MDNSCLLSYILGGYWLSVVAEAVCAWNFTFRAITQERTRSMKLTDKSDIGKELEFVQAHSGFGCLLVMQPLIFIACDRYT